MPSWAIGLITFRATMLCFILIITGLVLIVSDVQVVITTPPANTTTGVSFAAFNFYSDTVSPTGTISPITGKNVVNDSVDELRANGQNAPSGLPIVTVSLSSSWLDPAAQVFAPFQAYVDSCSPFNIANLMTMHLFHFPLGAECSLEWGDSGQVKCIFEFPTVLFTKYLHRCFIG